MVKVHTMKRMIYHLTENQIQKIKKYALETGLKPAEIVRRTIDSFFEKHDSKKNKNC